jgi:FG-GAP repeat
MSAIQPRQVRRFAVPRVAAVSLACLAALAGAAAVGPPASARAAGLTGPARPATGNVTPGAQLGTAVAASGSIIVVGAPGANLAKIYARQAGSWRLQARLTSPRHRNVGFGISVAVSGTTVVVGGDGARHQAGAAYVYARSGGHWRLQATLHDPRGHAGDSFGNSVAVSGGTIVSGAWGVLGQEGAAYIYHRSGTSWPLQATIADPGGSQLNKFGIAVAVSGSTAMITENDVFCEPGQQTLGCVYTYSRSGSAWSQQSVLPDPGNGAGFYGDSLAIDGTEAIIGSPGVRNFAGDTYIYRLTSSGWHHTSTLTKHRGLEYFGNSVAIAGRRAVIGAPLIGLAKCGRAYEFIRSGSRWRSRETIVNHGCSSGDLFGYAVALTGRTAVVGAPGKNHHAGQAYIAGLP